MNEDLLRQLSQGRRALWTARIYAWIMLFLVVLLGFAVLFQLIGVKVIYAFIPATIYVEAIVVLRLLLKTKVIDRVECKHVELDGSLKTAYEYRNKRNIIVDDLVSSVTDKLKVVGYSTFIDVEDLTYRVIMTVILSFIFLTVTVVTYQDLVLEINLAESALSKTRDEIRDQGERLFGGGIWESSENYSSAEEENELGAGAGGLQPGQASGPITGRGGGVGGEEDLDIYGEPGSANMWGQEISIEFHPEYGGDVDVDEAASGLGAFDYSMPEVSGAQEYKDYPVEQEELVRKYFEKLLEGE